MIDMDNITAALDRYKSADQAITAAYDHSDDLRFASETARRNGDVEAEKKAKAEGSTYSSQVWYPAYLEEKAAAKHLAEALGLDPARLGSALR